jgi:glycogen debranching enzyme
LAEIGVKHQQEQQFYIEIPSSPADDRTRVLKHGKMFAVFDRYGNVESRGLGEQGIYYKGTRYLSKSELLLGNSRPLLLSSTVRADNSMFSADLSNLDMSELGLQIPRGTLHLIRTKFLWRGACYEKFRISNYGLKGVALPLRIRFDADFADIFEVRGIKREAKGRRLQEKINPDSVTLSYEGRDQVLRQVFLSCEPRPNKISESEFLFDITLEARTEAVLTLTIACDPSGEATETYESAWLAAVGELNESHSNACRIESSSDQFNQWIKRSQTDVDMMIVGNPERNYPYAGVPWFSTVFGRDGIITAMQCLWLNPGIARGVLEYLAATQATEVIPELDAEPGKIVHEMREGEMAILGEVPFRQYYGSVDATPLFIMLAEAYYRRTADLDLLQQIWPNIERALDWINNYGDQDGDGFVEYCRQTDTGLVQQGWKDSNDSVFHDDGTLAKGPIALCEVQAYVYGAKQGAAHLAAALGDQARADLLQTEAAALKLRFNEVFWCYDLGTYALALDGEKRPCRVRASNAGHCLYTGIANPENARVVAQGLLSRDFFTAWGIRTLARGEARYNPLSYHNGSVWPHDNSLIAAGLARYGYKAEAAQVLSSLLDASMHIELNRLPELFCGMERRPGEGPTLYPVACSPQAWAAGAAFLLLQACLGLSVDAEKQQIRFDDPYLPDGVSKLYLRDLHVAGSRIDIVLERQDYLVLVHTIEQRGNAEVIVT